MILRFFGVAILISVSAYCFSQELIERDHYIGILPSVLFEPYDTIDAVEVNIFPLVYEKRIDENWAVQVRPMINFRFLKGNNGVSQLGGTIVVNRYLPRLLEQVEWLTPILGAFYSYTYNRKDHVNTMILGIEPGVFFSISDKISITTTLQPGIDYFPDNKSRESAGTDSGFLPHFGIIFHAGINLK